MSKNIAFRVVMLSVGLSFMTGCAWLTPHDHPAEYREAPEMTETLAAITERLEHWPEERWWLEFNSPELNELMERALTENPGLKAATARLHEAQAIVRVEGARLLPFLDADASLTYERISQHGVFNALSGGRISGIRVLLGIMNPLSFRYEFDFWGKNRAALEAALGQAAAEEAERAEVRLRLTTAIARAYIRALALRDQLALAKQMVALRRDLKQMTEIRFRFGLDDELAVKDAIAELEVANKREAGVQDQYDVQRHLLARLSGQGPDAIRRLTARAVTIPKAIPAPSQLAIGLLVHRPDLAAALYRAEASAKRVKYATTLFLPSIDLTGFVGFNAVTPFSPLTRGAGTLGNLLFSGQSFAYGIAPGLRLPWFEGGRLRGELTARRAEFDAAVELYNETLLDAIREVADSLSAWQTSRDALEAHHRLLLAVSDDLRLSRVRLTGGLDDDRHILRRQHPVLEQEYALKALESDHVVAMVDLIESLGGGYHNVDVKVKAQ